MSSTTAATLRKQRQRARQKQLGLRRMELSISETVVQVLERIAKVTGGDFKTESEIALRRALPGYLAEIEKAVAHGSTLWNGLQKYVPYRNFLATPGAHLRVKNEVFTAEEMNRIDREMEQFLFLMRKRGWTDAKTLEMLKLKAKSDAPQSSPH